MKKQNNNPQLNARVGECEELPCRKNSPVVSEENTNISADLFIPHSPPFVDEEITLSCGGEVRKGMSSMAFKLNIDDIEDLE